MPTRSSAASGTLLAALAVAARVDVREHHVLDRGVVAEQVEGLEHEADPARAHATRAARR